MLELVVHITMCMYHGRRIEGGGNPPSLPFVSHAFDISGSSSPSLFQVGKEVLCPRQPEEGETAGFNLLMELLRGDH